MAKSKPLSSPSIDPAPLSLNSSEPPEMKKPEAESDWRVVSPKTQFHAPAGVVELDAVVLCAWLDVLRFRSGRMAADLFADNALLKISIMRLRALSVATGQTIADLIADAWTDENALAQRDLRALLEILPQFRAPDEVKEESKAVTVELEAPVVVEAKLAEPAKVVAQPDLKLAPDSAKPDVYGPFPLTAGQQETPPVAAQEKEGHKEGRPQELHAAA